MCVPLNKTGQKYAHGWNISLCMLTLAMVVTSTFRTWAVSVVDMNTNSFGFLDMCSVKMLRFHNLATAQLIYETMNWSRSDKLTYLGIPGIQFY